MVKEDTDAAPAETCNCLAIRQAARQITQMYDVALAPVGLRTTQYSVLNRLDRLGPSSVQDLADALVLDRSTLGHNLRPLERNGFIRLATDRDDRRTRRLELTASGKAKLESAGPLWRAAQARFESNYGKTDAKNLRTALRRVVETVTP
jgi:DNA-binding MarR family transcriptional regulator